MKPTHIGAMAGALAVTIYAYFEFKRHMVGSNLRPSTSEVAESKTLPHQNLGTGVLPGVGSMPAGVNRTENKAGTNREVHQDIDRLKAEKSPEAVDALLKYLDHPSNWVKAHALEAIEEIGSARALPRLVEMLSQKGDVLAIRGAYMAIAGIGPNMTNSEERQLAMDGLIKSLELDRNESDQESRNNVYELMEAAGHLSGSESGEFLIQELPKFHLGSSCSIHNRQVGRLRISQRSPCLGDSKPICSRRVQLPGQTRNSIPIC